MRKTARKPAACLIPPPHCRRGRPLAVHRPLSYISGVGGKRILFVDSDEMMLEAIPEILKGLGYAVIAQTVEQFATSGICPEDGWIPGLILADSSAAAAIERGLKERAVRYEADIPVIFITVPWEDFTAGIETTWKLLYKPFTKAELVAALDGMFGHAPLKSGRSKRTSRNHDEGAS